MSDSPDRALLRLVLRAQAIYYVLTGAWPLLSITTFERVTGPKVDDWLVYMVGLLAVSTGVALRMEARASRPSGSIILLAVVTAISFAAIDIWFALAGRISPVYLLDVAAEAVLLFVIGLGWARARHASSENRDHAA